MWKILDGTVEGPLSNYDKSSWTVGEWRDMADEFEDEFGYKWTPRVSACECGFHASPTLLDAFQFVEGAVIAQVETDGDEDDDREWHGEKTAFERMRLVRVWSWGEDDYKALVEEYARYYDEQHHNDFLSEQVARFRNEGYHWQGCASIILSRSLTVPEWDHINEWWENYLETRGE